MTLSCMVENGCFKLKTELGRQSASAFTMTKHDVLQTRQSFQPDRSASMQTIR